ncbi:MAG: hypothetical protein HY671_01190 [Chloroflexi bacterium]|nr:hypothetical protein [Chloroflexota bacterium]
MKNTFLMVAILALAIVSGPAVQSQVVGAPTVQIVSPMPGAMVMGPDVTFTFQVTNFVLAPAEIGMPPIPGHGHFHVLLDGTLVGIVGVGTHALMGLMPGMHTVKVELHQNNHLPLTPPVEASVTFTVM